jgi:hypothetical protein
MLPPEASDKPQLYGVFGGCVNELSLSFSAAARWCGIAAADGIEVKLLWREEFTFRKSGGHNITAGTAEVILVRRVACHLADPPEKEVRCPRSL